MGTFAQKAAEKAPARSAPPDRAYVAQIHEMSAINQLQRRIGNQALQRMLQAHASETKKNAGESERSHTPMRGGAPAQILTINTPGDAHEQEADRVAEQVMRMPAPQRSSASGYPKHGSSHSGHAQVQTKSMHATDMGGAAAPPIVHNVLRSPGRPLDAATRAFMEPRFGQDFGHVRVHTDAKAAESAAAVNAAAYTVGHNVVFGEGQFVPHSPQGEKLLAHELAHVSQNSQGTVRRQDHDRQAKAGQALAEETRRYIDRTVIGSLDNRTKHDFEAEGSAGKEGAKVSFTLKAGEKRGGKGGQPARGPNGERLTDVDFVLPTKDHRINSISSGKFKIGWNDAVLSPVPNNPKYSVITNYSGYTENMKE